MKNFKHFIKEKVEKVKEKLKLQSITKKKHLLKHTVLIQAEEGDPVKGTQSRINIKSLNDCNILGFITFNSYEDATATFERLTNLDEIVEYMQRNSKRFSTCADWSYIVRDEIDKRSEIQSVLEPELEVGEIEEEVEDDVEDDVEDEEEPTQKV